MRVTRIIALAVVAGTFGLHTSDAQTLKDAQPPAEFPPASYKGKQYVDSRGCIYIRAGIDGNVTWVPRVSRNRKQVCGYQPTNVAGSTAAPAAPSTSQAEVITVPGGGQTAAPAAAAPAAPAPKPAATTTTTTYKPSKPLKTTKDPIPKVSVTTAAAAKPAKPAPVAPTKPAATAAATRPAQSGCSNASALSQQYINNTPDVRCGPQSEAPVTYGRGGGIGPQSSLRLTPNTRIVPAHVYDNRQNTLPTEPVPEGFRTVWEDGRLNPHRAERGLQPAVLSQQVIVPAGFRVVDREDDRLNPMRGIRTAAGDAQTALIWDNSVPRKLVKVDTSAARRITLPNAQAESLAEAEDPAFLFASRSAPDAPAPEQVLASSYIRAASYKTDAEARAAAQSLAKNGLPVRLGTLKRGNKEYRLVLAGPYATRSQARQALPQVRSAGFGSARLN